MFILYLTIDLSSPFVPGAFRFDPDESVEGVAGYRDTGKRARQGLHRSVAPTQDARSGAVAAVSARVRHEARPAARVAADWVVEARRSQHPPGPPSPLAEDH